MRWLPLPRIQQGVGQWRPSKGPPDYSATTGAAAHGPCQGPVERPRGNQGLAGGPPAAPAHHEPAGSKPQAMVAMALPASACGPHRIRPGVTWPWGRAIAGLVLEKPAAGLPTIDQARSARWAGCRKAAVGQGQQAVVERENPVVVALDQAGEVEAAVPVGAGPACKPGTVPRLPLPMAARPEADHPRARPAQQAIHASQSGKVSSSDGAVCWACWWAGSENRLSSAPNHTNCCSSPRAPRPQDSCGETFRSLRQKHLFTRYHQTCGR